MDRKKVIKIFGGFLVVMLFFTILTRALNGASMARVQTVRTGTGPIEHKVTATGSVQPGEETAVCTESGQRVTEICVKEGQSVEKGDVLFRLDMEELEEQILTAQQEMEKSKLQNQDAQNAKAFEQSNQQTARQRAQEDYNQAVAQGDASVTEAKRAWDEAEWALQDFLNRNTAPQGTDEQTNEENSQGSDSQPANENPGGAEGGAADREAEKAALEQAVAEAKAAYDMAVSSRADSVRTAARAVEDASKPQSPADSTEKQNEITRQQQELALNKLLYLQRESGEVKATVDGVVTQILVSTGDFTSDGAAMRLADNSKSGSLTLSVDKFNEKYVSKGTPVKLTVSGTAEVISDYTVSSVTENKEDKNLLDVTIDLPKGTIEAGTMVDVQIVPKSETYTTVVPLQALHQEGNGYYVLVLQEEQGVLGLELVVKRLDVQVLDKNDTNAALEEGLLSSDQEIISSSSRMIQENSRVRRVDSAG